MLRYIQNYFGPDLKLGHYLFYSKEKYSPGSYSLFQHSFIQLKKDLKEENINITNSPYSLKHTGAKRFIDSKNVKSYQIIEAIMKHSDFLPLKNTFIKTWD